MRLLITLATWLAQAVYGAMKVVTRPGRKVVFLSRQSDAPSRDITMLAEELSVRDPELRIVIRCKTLGSTIGQRAGFLAATLGHMYHLATARVCVIDGYVVPVSVLDHREGLFVVQMWHALGAVKRFGYQSVGRPKGRSSQLAEAMRMHRNYDLVLCGGPKSVPVFAEAFGVDAAMVSPDGLPRMDALRDAMSGVRSDGTRRLVDRFPRLEDQTRRVILYAPTLRSDGAGRSREVVDAFDGDRYTVVVKPHPLEAIGIAGDHVVDATGVDAADLLPLCSAVITDYSAIAFEAAVVSVPVFFYVSDIDEYRRDVGLNVDPLVDMPEVSSREIGRLARLIDSGDTHPEVLRRLQDGWVSAPRGCTARIADRIMDQVGASESK